MNATPMLRLDHLRLHNFRCFAECTVDLHPQLTVLVAENGGGKTAVLDAIGIALGVFVDTVADVRYGADFAPADVRRVWDGMTMNPVAPTKVIAHGYVNGQLLDWQRARNGIGVHNHTTTKDTRNLGQAARLLRERVERDSETIDGHTILPLVAFYGTQRLWGEQPATDRWHDRLRIQRTAGYEGCLSPSSSVKAITDWYAATMGQTRDPRFSAQRPEKLLAAVRGATRIVLEPSGWRDLDWDFEQQLLVVEHPDHGRLPLSLLSDGVRTMIALVADIARRCATLNPHLGVDAARLTPGVLLIDEVDLHLHPGWQQQVVDLVGRAFPELQMILTTHSPQVLSTVDNKSIRVIDLSDSGGRFKIPRSQTQGVESANVLSEIMDVDPIPPVPQVGLLRRYNQLIQQHMFDTPEAQRLRVQLEQHFGSQHSVIQECDRMIRLERFKQSLPPLPQK